LLDCEIQKNFIFLDLVKITKFKQMSKIMNISEIAEQHIYELISSSRNALTISDVVYLKDQLKRKEIPQFNKETSQLISRTISKNIDYLSEESIRNLVVQLKNLKEEKCEVFGIMFLNDFYNN